MFITTLTGPLFKYRLDITRKVAPNVRDHLIVFTDKFSYDLYGEHHDFFNFVIMDDYRKNDEFSMTHELFPKFKTEKEFLEKIRSFYGRETGVYYPWETHRFIFPYLIENNIKNFAIVDTDFIFCDDKRMLEDFFPSVDEGSLYMLLYPEEPNRYIKELQEVEKKFPQITSGYKSMMRSVDGYFRGFHFKNFEDMQLFYDLWNELIKYPIKDKGATGALLYTSDWVVPYIMQIFENNFAYRFRELYDIISMRGYVCADIGRHYTRVEDTIYVGPRGGWDHYNFDYSDSSSISNFIRNNKEQLLNYYGTFDVEITDTHVYTKMR